MRRSSFSPRWWFLVALLLVAAPASAYNEQVHAALTKRALPDDGVVLQPPTQADLDAFRGLFYRAAAAQDPRFVQRFPSQASFDAWSFKEFVMLDPAKSIHGFDLTPDDARPLKRRDLLELASRWPDDDRRNQQRYFRDAQTHEPAHASDGSLMPYDPGTLDLGSLSGSSSQGHAHYGLIEGPLSDDPEVLKKEPRRFAIPPTVHAYGPEFAQLYTDLAALAAQSGLPSGPWLKAVFEGAAFHHLEDVCNQIHTVQVGIYDFFQSAFLQSKLRDVRTLGGLLGERRSLKTLGLRIISNHHLLSEDLFARRLRDKQVNLNAVDTDDEAFRKQALTAIDEKQGRVGLGLAKAIIDVSSLEAGQVYQLAFQFSAPTLRDGAGHEFVSGKDDPDLYLDASKAQALTDFFALETRGLVRAATALRLWEARFEPKPQLPVKALLDYHEAAAARRASYQPAGPDREGIAWGYPVAATLLLAGAAALIWSRLSKRS